MRLHVNSRNLYYLRTYPEEYNDNFNESVRVAKDVHVSLLVIAALDKGELAAILRDYLLNSPKEEYFRWMLVPGEDDNEREVPIMEAFEASRLHTQWFRDVLLRAFNIGKAIPTVKGIVASEVND